MAPPWRQHLPDFVLQAQEHAGEIDGQHGIERCLAQFMDALSGRANGASGDSRIVERAIDLSEGGNRARHHRCHVVFSRDVAAHRDRLTAGRIDQFDGRRSARVRAVGDRETSAFARHGQRRGPSDPRCTARHQRDFSVQDACHAKYPMLEIRVKVGTALNPQGAEAKRRLAP